MGSTLKQHPDVTLLPPDVSFGEYNLFVDGDILTHVFEKVTQGSFGSRLRKASEDNFLTKYAETWIDYLQDHYGIKGQKNIFIKSPFIDEWQLWIRAFPQARIALLCRDGRENVV